VKPDMPEGHRLGDNVYACAGNFQSGLKVGKNMILATVYVHAIICFLGDISRWN
jgi:hypothetical protein